MVLPSVTHIELGGSGRVHGYYLLLALTLLLLGLGGGSEEEEKAEGGEGADIQ
jgi:hypothetical protein